MKQYRKLEMAMINIYLRKLEDGSQAMKIIKKKIHEMIESFNTLADLLDKNIFDTRRVWKFHFEEYVPIVEEQVVKLWLLLIHQPDIENIEYPTIDLPILVLFFS